MNRLLHITWNLVLCLYVTQINGQVPKSGLQLNFNRQNNFTYSTRLGMNYLYQSPKYRLDFRFRHDQILNSSRSDKPFVQLLFRTQLWQFYRLKEKWEVASWLEADQFLTTLNQSYSLYAGFHWKPHPAIEITPLIGYSWDYRSLILDQGIAPALQFRSAYKWKDGLQMESYLLAKEKFIRPRHQRNWIFKSAWSKQFEENASFFFQVQGGSVEMDNYQSESIKKIKADTISGIFGFQYTVFPGLVWESQNMVSSTRRKFDYVPFNSPKVEFNDLRFDQLNIVTRQVISGSAKNKKWDGYFSYEYQFLNRRYELENSQELPEPEFMRLRERERQKDYFRNLTRMEFVTNFRPNKRHHYKLTGTNRYLQYDTPEEQNFDDHDELNYGLSLQWKARWAQNFSTTYNLIGNMRRYAFLFKERSQDNYTQPSLRMEFGYDWSILPQLRLSGEQLIYVTYNVKDFEDRNLTDRSTRNLESRAKLQYRPNPRLNSELSVYRREIHVSYLNWEAFSETTLDTTITYIIESHNRLQLKRDRDKARIILDVGYKHFSQLRYQNTAMISLENILTPINLHIRSHQTGPITGLSMRTRNASTIELSVWWQLQYLDYKYIEIPDFTTLSSNYREAQLQNPEIFFRPFIRFQVNWQLKSGRN